MLLKILKYSAIALIGIVVVLAGVIVVLYLAADMKQPQVAVDLDDYPVVVHEGYKECRGNMLRRSESGLWETYLHGGALERGTALGRMSEDLLYFQERAFVDQIRRIVPSDGYLKFLRYLLVAFNRNLGKNVPEEYREEIYGISLSCTHEFDAIGTPYERQLNYHAAHDIGHTMQDYMLVGCSSFAAWGGASADSTLVIGRNFDFWVGDEFAHNKIVMFYAPDDGYRFASVSWPGMTGVLSGMNEKGLTVSLNAAKGALPTSSAMPISVLAREILQYASNIEQALAIAQKRHTFVSESLLIGSAEDGCAAVIEKTPGRTELFSTEKDYVVCTNHYQSEAFAAEKRNVENIHTSDSPYRFARIEEMIHGGGPIDSRRAAEILRDRCGQGGSDIGLTNEKSINQSIAHHSVIFKPEARHMWVSAGPWQSGRYVCYDLGRVFDGADFSGEIYDSELSLPADSLFMERDYQRVLDHRKWNAEVKAAASERRTLEEAFIERFTSNNAEYYGVWNAVADYYIAAGDTRRAAECLETALSKEIPRLHEKEAIEKKLRKLRK